MKTFFLLFLALIIFLTTANINKASVQEEGTIKVDATLVLVPVIVSDRNGRYISGLQAADFALYEDRVRQQIAFFDSAEEPLNVAILIDTSKSTRFVLDEIKDAAKGFLKELRSKDRAMVVSFDYQVNILSELTSDQKLLKSRIDSAEIGASIGTVLRDAVSRVLNEYFKQIKGRKAIILLTDGKDHKSHIRTQQLFYNAEESDTMIYSVYYHTTPAKFIDDSRIPIRRRRSRLGDIWSRGDQQRRREQVEQKNQEAVDFLEDLSASTAGRLFESEASDLKKVFHQIAEELRYQYQLGFYPDGDRKGGELYSLKVELSNRQYIVRARKNYRLQSNALPSVSAQ
ncbi:MAG: VWA domain-containing protein [Blastocatellia bacterium]|nr:VWA domain-containing protein [Blastocatellia bacterium]